MSGALVVGDGSAAFVLPAVRSLGRAGWTVGVGQPAPGLATASRWCRRHHVIPPVELDPPGWVDAVAAAVAAGGYDVVFPADDIELLALSAWRDRIPAVVPYAAHDVVLAAVDKLTLTRAGEAAGLAVPRTVAVTDDALDRITGPTAVKSRLHWTPSTAAGVQPSEGRHLLVRIVDTPAAARDAVAAVRRGGGEPMLQDVVDGGLMAVSLVVGRDGRVVAYAQQATELLTVRRTSARARTVAPDPDLQRGVLALLQSLGWWGLANLQFLQPAGGGPPQLIDLNGRFYGSLALAVAAGADLPVRWAEVAVGADPGPPQIARPGVRFQTFDEELVARRSAPGRAGGTLGAVRYAAAAHHSIWAVSDPRPAMQRLTGRVARRLGARAGR